VKEWPFNENITSSADWSGRMIERSQQVKVPREKGPFLFLINEPTVGLFGERR
jgi:hypothetical protein